MGSSYSTSILFRTEMTPDLVYKGLDPADQTNRAMAPSIRTNRSLGNYGILGPSTRYRALAQSGTLWMLLKGELMFTPRADVIGSLLRPPYLLGAKQAFAEDRIRREELAAAEDRAVDEAVALQEDVGLPVVTDGEMRRESFQSQMTAAVEGFSEHALDAFLWGEWHSDELGDWSVARPELRVVSKLKRRRFLSAHELTYLQTRTKVVAKVTLPSPTLFVNFWSESSRDAYPSHEEYLADVVQILREEVGELARLGARYIQIDAPHYTALLDPAGREFYERQGWSVEGWLARGIELENAVMENQPDVTFGFHL